MTSIVRQHRFEGRGKGRGRRGFSLVEVLLAIFILGIGMIMVASVFPVGANWTRETTEESVGQQIAQNAVTILQQYYGQGGPLNQYMNPANLQDPNSGIMPDAMFANAFALQAMPNFPLIPPAMRAYQFGSSTPFPVKNRGVVSNYFWTALCRLNPGQDRDPSGAFKASSSYKYDIYILVFRKGAVEHLFSYVSAKEILNMRNVNAMSNPNSELFIPSVWRGSYYAGDINNGGSPSVINAVPSMGGIGIGAWSGTVFTQRYDPISGKAVARPALMGQTPTIPPSEPVIFSPPADGTQTSPLIYVYQTTLSL